MFIDPSGPFAKTVVKGSGARIPFEVALASIVRSEPVRNEVKNYAIVNLKKLFQTT